MPLVFVLLSSLLVLISFIVKKNPSILAGYKKDIPRKEVTFIYKSMFILGIVYLFLVFIPLFTDNKSLITIYLLCPIIFWSILILFIKKYK